MDRELIQTELIGLKNSYNILYMELRSALDGSVDRLTLAEIEAMEKDLAEMLDRHSRLEAVLSQFKAIATNGSRVKEETPFEGVIKVVGEAAERIHGINPYEEKPRHTEIGQCTSSCRRVGCQDDEGDDKYANLKPEDDIFYKNEKEN